MAKLPLLGFGFLRRPTSVAVPDATLPPPSLESSSILGVVLTLLTYIHVGKVIGMMLRDVHIAIELTHDRAILAFSQGIVVAYMDVGKGREQERKLCCAEAVI